MTDAFSPPSNGHFWTDKPFPDRDRQFSFAVLPDRTALGNAAIFDAAMDQLNALGPDFVLSIGDLIEGYDRDEAVIADQWAAFDAMVDRLDMPFFYLPGNHDISGGMMEKVWHQRHGAGWYHFRYKDVLFLCLNSEDPPNRMLIPELDKRAEDIRELAKTDPDAAAKENAKLLEELPHARLTTGLDDEEGMHVAYSEDQIAYMEQAIADNKDARWTFVLTHQPGWETAHPGWKRLTDVLGDKPYTALAGHDHYYSHRVIDGRDHIRLGKCGASYVHDGPGNIEHLLWVTMGTGGPLISNIKLDGLLERDLSPMNPDAI